MNKPITVLNLARYALTCLRCMEHMKVSLDEAQGIVCASYAKYKFNNCSIEEAHEKLLYEGKYE